VRQRPDHVLAQELPIERQRAGKRQHLGQELGPPRSGAGADDGHRSIPPCWRENSWRLQPEQLDEAFRRAMVEAVAGAIGRQRVVVEAVRRGPAHHAQRALEQLSVTSPSTVLASASLKACSARRSGLNQKPS